jgi:hypothetical protein
MGTGYLNLETPLATRTGSTGVAEVLMVSGGIFDSPFAASVLILFEDS